MKTSALILIDLQNDYFAQGANPLFGSEDAVLQARRVLQFYRQQQLPVIHIQHIANREGASFFIPNTKGAEIHSMLAPLGNERVIVKHFPNSFRETDLLTHLQALNVEKLTIAGMMTQMCVDATVRAAQDFGFDCTLIADACASKTLTIGTTQIDASQVHSAFVAALSYFYARVITAEEFLS